MLNECDTCLRIAELARKAKEARDRAAVEHDKKMRELAKKQREAELERDAALQRARIEDAEQQAALAARMADLARRQADDERAIRARDNAIDADRAVRDMQFKCAAELAELQRAAQQRREQFQRQLDDVTQQHQLLINNTKQSAGNIYIITKR